MGLPGFEPGSPGPKPGMIAKLHYKPNEVLRGLPEHSEGNL